MVTDIAVLRVESLDRVVAGVSMTWARYQVGCHTILQGIRGMLVGAMCFSIIGLF
jgi:hypothetical protein